MSTFYFPKNENNVVSKQPFSGENDPFSINPAVIQAKITEKMLSIFLVKNDFTSSWHMERNLFCGK